MRVSKRVLWITAVAVALAVAAVAWLIVSSEPAAARAQQGVHLAPASAPVPGRTASPRHREVLCALRHRQA